MLSIDPPDDEEEGGEENRSTGHQTPNPAHGQTTPGSKSPRLPNPEGTMAEESSEMSVEVHEETSEKKVPPIIIVSFPKSHVFPCIHNDFCAERQVQHYLIHHKSNVSPNCHFYHL